MIGLVTPFLPYQKIDFSRPAIIKSLEHKFLFLCTTPIFFVGYLVANIVGSLVDYLIEPGFGFLSTGLVIWITIFVWIFFSLWCWELFMGENKSITLRNLRTERKNNRFDSPSNISQVSIQPKYEKDHKSVFGKVSLRTISFMCGLPILFIMLGIALDPNGGFVSLLLISISINIFAFFFSFLIFRNYLNKQGHSLEFLNQINDHLFGNTDIDNTFFIIGFVLMVTIFLFSSIIEYFLPKGMFILIYLLLVLIFILTVWSNQIKALFHYL